MATKQLKLKGKTIVWGANLNVRINSIYTKDGKSYQNITGRNSDPETPGNPDWFKIDDVAVDLSNKLDKPENTYDPSEDPGEIYVVLVDADDVSYRIPLSEVGDEKKELWGNEFKIVRKPGNPTSGHLNNGDLITMNWHPNDVTLIIAAEYVSDEEGDEQDVNNYEMLSLAGAPIIEE